jgi:hypothetical protein
MLSSNKELCLEPIDKYDFEYEDDEVGEDDNQREDTDLVR